MLKKIIHTYRKDLIHLSILVFLIFAFFIRLFYPEPSLVSMPEDHRSDNWHFNLPLKYLLSEKLQTGTLPMWSKNIGGGFPLLGQSEIGMFYPLNLMLFYAFDFVLAYNLNLIFTFALLGSGFYVWLRMIRCQPLAALFGGMTLTFSAAPITQMNHFALLQTVSLLPWILVCTHLLIFRATIFMSLIVALIFSFQVFAGFPQMTLITGLTATLYLLILGRYTKSLFKIVTLFGIAILITLCLSAIQLLPSFEFQQNVTVAKGFSLSQATHYSFPLNQLLSLLWPFIHGDPRNATYSLTEHFNGNVFWENAIFIGWVPIIVILGLFKWRKKISHFHKPFIQFGFVYLAISFLLMLGKYSPVAYIYSLFPFNLFKVPSRFAWVFVYSLILLSALGFQMVSNVWRNSQKKRILISLLILQLACNFAIWWNYQPVVPAHRWIGMPPEVLTFISPNDRVMSLFEDESYFNTYKSSGWNNVDDYFFLNNTLSPNSNLFWHTSQIDVYSGRLLRRPTTIKNLLRAGITANENAVTINAVSKTLIDMMGVTKLISTRPLNATNIELVTILDSQTTKIHIYKNSQAAPRSYIAESIQKTSTLGSFYTIIQNNFEPGKTVVVEEDLGITTTNTHAPQVHVLLDTDDRVKIEIRGTTQDSLLVLTDTYYPGWIALVDGKETKIYPANVTHRAVKVTPGDHVIEFRYKPASHSLGSFISTITLGCIGLYFLYISVRRSFKKISYTDRL